jgi:hypothetical protein
VQIEQLLNVLQSQSKELAKLKGNENELQEKLALIETLTKQSAEVAEQLEKLAPGSQRRSARNSAMQSSRSCPSSNRS